MPVTKGRRWIIAALFVSAPWPRIVDLDSLPPDAPATFRDEAFDTFRLAHDHPIERLWLTVMAQNLRLTDWRIEPGSCAGGSTTWPHLRDVRVTLTVIGPWGIPMGREAITCGGAGWQRDAFFVAATLAEQPVVHGPTRTEPVRPPNEPSPPQVPPPPAT